jgi:type II secretory pathway pseudopilin PulG
MKKHNFTLVEILGVIALIVVLMVISAGVYTYASNSAKEKATQATITRIYNGLQLLLDKGFLPVTGGDYVKIAIDNSLLLKINDTVVGADDNTNFVMQGMLAGTVPCDKCRF